MTNDTGLDEWLAFAHELADAARAILGPAARQRPDIEIKADRSFVTALDARIEAHLRERIDARYPSHGILGEEQAPRQMDSDLVWVLDPIDGTAPFVAGIPVFGTLIALAREGVPVIGVMDLPVTAQRWVGVEGRATRLDGTAIRTRACPALAGAILTTSNPDFYQPHERAPLAALRERTAWRIYGGCCMSYGLLAQGRTDLAIDTGLKTWDYAPFKPIIEGAGGIITDWQGRPIDLRTGAQILAAGDVQRHAEALALVDAALRSPASSASSG